MEVRGRDILGAAILALVLVVMVVALVMAARPA
jgi:hypothetical protein